MTRALRAWAINWGGKNSFRNLQYGPRARLVRGMYASHFETILVARGRAPIGLHQASRPVRRSNTGSPGAIYGLPVTLRMLKVKCDLIGWKFETITLRMNQKLDPPRGSRFLVLTKSSVDSGDENGLKHDRSVLNLQNLRWSKKPITVQASWWAFTLIKSLNNTRRQWQWERHQTKDLRTRAMAVHLRYKLLYSSLPSSAHD